MWYNLKMKEIERYSEEEAFDEANEIKAKVWDSGDASVYDEAEIMVDIENGKWPYYMPEVSEIPSIYKRLWEEHTELPLRDSEKLWEEVTELAEREEGTSRSERGIYGQIPLKDLLELAEKVKGEKDSIKKYSFLAEKSPNGEIWFEVLNGLSSKITLDKIAQRVGMKQWGNVADIGSGIGALTRKIEPYCDSLVGVDRVPALVEIADERKRGKEEYILTDALDLPFEDGSLDLVVSNSLIASLSKDKLTDFVEELSRAIKPGGSYLDGGPMKLSDGVGIDTRIDLANSKGIIADMIVDVVNGRAEMENPIEHLAVIADVFREFGFEVIYDENPEETSWFIECKK